MTQARSPAPSLLWRARLRLAGLSLLVMGTLLYAAGFTMGRLLLQSQEAAIQRELQSLAGTLHDSLKPALPQQARPSAALARVLPGLCLVDEPCHPPKDLLYRHAISASDPERYKLKVFDPHGRLLASSPGALPPGPEPGRVGWALSGSRDGAGSRVKASGRWGTYGIHLHHAHGHGEPIWGYLQISTSLAELDAEASRIWWLGHGVFLLAMLAIGAASWWLAGLAMAPLLEAYRRQEQFSADVAHELRTPLANLLALVEAERCRGQPNDSRRSEASGLDRVLVQGRRLQQLIADLLLLARLERAAAQAPPALCDWSELVSDVLEDFSEPAATAQIDLDSNALSPGIQVRGEEAELSRLVINLLSNALHHTQAGGRVAVRLERQGKDSLLTISDSGPGIASEQQTLIFERFTRLDPARSRQQGGAGLGLAIAQAIARRHGGNISVQSSLGEGAAFSVRLPAGA
jgi:two-component Ni(II)/redox sensor kinase NrsS